MPTIDLGSVVGPQGEQGNTGPQGEQGVAGPSLISASTQTTLTGVLAGDGSTVGVRAVDGVPTFYSTNLVTSGGVYSQVEAKFNYAKSTIVKPNLLDNWYFVGGGTDGNFPINQRGQLSYSGNVYGIDRWKCGNNYGSATVVSAGYQITGTTAFYPVNQTIENGPTLLDGKTVTLSALTASGELVYGTATINLTSTVTYLIVLNTSNGGVVMLTGSTSVMSVLLRANAGYTETYVAVKLELGDTQTLCHNENGVFVLNEIPNYTEELYKCYRYFYRFSGLYTAAALAGSTVTATTIPFPVPMRAAPSQTTGITNISTFDDKTYTGYGTYASCVRFYNGSSVAFSITGFDASAEL